jgi:ornithine cyclodeaminase/alanine dehydrogenase-like protein (mu-crystallin family)
VHTLAPGGPGSPLISLLMPAWLPGRYYALKVVNIAADNAARGLPGVMGSVLLFDATSGQPLALMDGGELTSRRTAAASALAASMLARPDASHLLVIGAGQVARLLPAAHASVRPVRRVTVWARDGQRARALAEALSAQGFDADSVDIHGLPAVAGAADIVSCATLATEPVVRGEWLRPGCHLDLIGSFTPAMREADDACFTGARLVVDTDEALHKSGDLLGPMSRGVFSAADVAGTLADLCRGSAPGRLAAGERTVFKSVGAALEDLAAAMRVYEDGRPSTGA